ncbi:hypothetical protein [Pseudonocardia sp.]|uniref:hypothetical protein n=1 Tax=Pseudonocardia sp. TaxID=60912 RepID=UPI002624CE52|nr:hypothetical protein [Pseudonocardia sp.]
MALAPSALAWYPDGFSSSGGPCGSTSGLGEAVPLASIEPLVGHTGPWGPVRTTYESPTNKTTESVQRRAVAVRSTGEICESGGIRRISYVYSRFEERTQTTFYTKAGGSTRLITIPNNPRISEWAPV